MLLITIVNAHSGFLIDIDLDFDPALKEAVTKAAQDYLNINEQPREFHFDQELIVVQFDRTLELSASINPLDFSIFGFRDDNAASNNAEEKFDQEQRKTIAETILEIIPAAYKEELVYAGEKKAYTGTYTHTWYRYINNIYVGDEYFWVEVDANTGKVTGWRLAIFAYPKERIKTTPALSHKVAQKIAELRYNAEPIEGFQQFLLIDNNEPVWVTKVKSSYPFFVLINALTGRIESVGNIKAVLPEDYSYGKEVQIEETSFIKDIYNS